MTSRKGVNPFHNEILASMDELCDKGAEPVEALASSATAGVVWLHARVQELTLLVMELALLAEDKCASLEEMADLSEENLRGAIQDLRDEAGL